MIAKVTKLVWDEDGGTSVEYAFILALIAVVSASVLSALGPDMTRTFRAMRSAFP